MPKAKSKAIPKAKSKAMPKAKPKAKSRARLKAESKAAPKAQQKPLFFWLETETEGGFLSPWYRAPFYDQGRTYLSVGQWVMAAKAQLFHDEETLKKVLASKASDTLRALGSNVKNFDEEVWKRESFRLVREANYLKFTREVSKSDICDRLLATGERELVDASPFDRVWGIGFKAADAKKMDDNREQWGENQFGKTLMEVRRTIEFQRDPDATAVFDTPGSGFYINW